MCSFTSLFGKLVAVPNKVYMTQNKKRFFRLTWVVSLLIILGLSTSSCHRARYRRMVRKRRASSTRHKTHKSTYQKKLRKKSISTSSKYYIKNQKRNYRRKPWYDKN
jgi:cytochrome c biogenesis protein ResB